jgi:hypothetical protein
MLGPAWVVLGAATARLKPSDDGGPDGFQAAPGLRRQPRDGLFVAGDDDFPASGDSFQKPAEAVLRSQGGDGLHILALFSIAKD